MKFDAGYLTSTRDVWCPCLQRAKLLCLLLMVTSSFFKETESSSACDTDTELTLEDKFESSEMVIRGKIVQTGADSQTFLVKVLNVYKGCNSTEGQTVNIYNFPFATENEDGSQPLCMTSAVIREKYIFYLEGQSPHNEGSSYTQYIADRATKVATRTVRQLAQEAEPEGCNDFVTTMATETQSDADHYAPCTEFYQEHYCKNGGTCQYIIALGKNTCECPARYHGPRCRLYEYGFNTGEDIGGDATPFIIVGLMFAFILLLCILVLVLYIRNRKKTHEQLRTTDVENELYPKESATDSNQNTTRTYHSSEDEMAHTGTASNEDVLLNGEHAENEESRESESLPLTNSNSQTASKAPGSSKQSTV